MLNATPPPSKVIVLGNNNVEFIWTGLKGGDVVKLIFTNNTEYYCWGIVIHCPTCYWQYIAHAFPNPYTIQVYGNMKYDLMFIYIPKPFCTYPLPP